MQFFYSIVKKAVFLNDPILRRTHLYVLMVAALVLYSLILLYNSNGAVPNCYFDKSWKDGKTLVEISENKFLKEYYSSSPNNVFFHETSCSDDGILRLNARQACAIESTALANPDHNIFVTFASQVGFRNTSRLPIIDAILSYPNVHLNYLNLTKYAENTPLECWIKTDELFKSNYVISHTSDVLRFLSMYKYGGTYLDLDVVMLKSLNSLGHDNYAAAESDYAIAVGIIHMEGDSGHQIADRCIKDLRKNFNGTNWANNGPKVLNRVLNEICNTQDVKKMIYDDVCKNFRVLPRNMCYDIGWIEFEKFFKEEYLHETLNRISEKLMTHVWNKFSAELPLSKNDNVAYIHLAKKHCPRVFKACDKF